MTTIEKLKELYNQAKYREIIVAVRVEDLDSRNMDEAEKLLLLAWAYHQLGEYKESLAIFEDLRFRCYLPESTRELEIGTSAERGVAHGLLQTGGDFTKVETIMQVIQPSLDLDNVYMNAAIAKARKGEAISVGLVIGRIMAALGNVPYKTVNGHVVNNGAFALHEARKQEVVKYYIPILPGLINAAIGIYETTGAAKNHIAGAEFRASQICEANGWQKIARISAQESVALWQELVKSQDGERYKKNLEGAQVQLTKLALAQ